MAKKCPVCDLPITDEASAIPYKKRLVHPKCFNNMSKVIKTEKDKQLKDKLDENKSKSKKTVTKPKAEIKAPVSEEEYKKKKEFFDYIRSYYNTADGKLPAKIYVLTEKYIEQYGYTYESMLSVLKYMREIQGKDIKGDGVGLIPYMADEAEEYYKSLQTITDINKDKDVDKMYKPKVVCIKPKKRDVKQISIEDIGE